MAKKTKTFDEKLTEIWSLCGQGKEQFRVSAIRELGIQTLWVSGDAGNNHRGIELQRFPMFTVFVTAEQSR